MKSLSPSQNLKQKLNSRFLEAIQALKSYKLFADALNQTGLSVAYSNVNYTEVFNAIPKKFFDEISEDILKGGSCERIIELPFAPYRVSYSENSTMQLALKQCDSDEDFKAIVTNYLNDIDFDVLIDFYEKLRISNTEHELKSTASKLASFFGFEAYQFDNKALNVVNDRITVTCPFFKTESEDDELVGLLLKIDRCLGDVVIECDPRIPVLRGSAIEEFADAYRNDKGSVKDGAMFGTGLGVDLELNKDRLDVSLQKVLYESVFEFIKNHAPDIILRKVI